MELLVGDQTIDVGQPRQRAVLAALLVDAGQVVTWEALIDRVWGDASPANPRASLRVHVARIRRALEGAAAREHPARVLHRSGGYSLEIGREQVDLHRFRRLVRAANTAEGTTRAALFRDAVGLWRGTPLGGLDGSWVTRMRQNWTQERLDALVAWADAELVVGNPDLVVGPLADLAVDHPMAESVTAVLMRSLHAVGRSVDALDRYNDLRKQLSEELGIDPAPEVQALFRRSCAASRCRRRPPAPRPRPIRCLAHPDLLSSPPTCPALSAGRSTSPASTLCSPPAWRPGRP
jgi:DNA-binding SARP family transcriptional activator